VAESEESSSDFHQEGGGTFPRKKTNMAIEHPPFEDVFPIRKWGIFQPVMLVNSGVEI